MSFPQPDTTFGDITFDGRNYRMFSVPLDSKNHKKITDYKRKKGSYNSAPWTKDNYSWIIRDKKLYLREVTLFGGSGNLMVEIFGVDELFASWQNDDIEVLVSKENLDICDKPKMKLIQMKIKILKFKDGRLLSIKDKSKEIEARKSLMELGLLWDE